MKPYDAETKKRFSEAVDDGLSQMLYNMDISMADVRANEITAARLVRAKKELIAVLQDAFRVNHEV